MKTPAKRILVVDDETVIRHNVSELLRACGFDVTEGGDGDEVPHLASQENPDLIILDIHMPHVDGFVALRELRHDPTTEHIPVLMLTSINDYELGGNYDCESVGQHAGTRAPEAFLEKPFDGRHLIREVIAACA